MLLPYLGCGGMVDLIHLLRLCLRMAMKMRPVDSPILMSMTKLLSMTQKMNAVVVVRLEIGGVHGLPVMGH